jgi:hypothetical protein
MTESTHVEGRSIRPLVIVVIFGVVFFAWMAWRVSITDSAPSNAALECSARYAEAGSFADTARVDATYPTDWAQHRGLNRGPATCGELRREHLLQ